ncbi:MAG: DUF5103 domain-containing protein [Bacteroidia bacterium]
MRKVSLFTFIFLSFFYTGNPLVAQKNADEYSDPNRLRYEDHVYRNYIKTVQMHQSGWKFSPPVIELNSGQRLVFEFDDLDGDYKSYYYTFIHCDADWQPSDLNNFDFMKGYEQDFINDYSTSANTLQKYTHYRITIPNNNIQLLISGNYLLKVYLNNNPDSVVITRRFMVYEKKLGITAREKPGVGYELNTRQQIVFSINTTRYSILDPFHALQVFILQNGRWDNAIANVQPQFVTDTALQYFDDLGNNSFDGGNQFRNFDMTSLQMISDHIARFIPNYDYPEVQLKEDKPRANDPYITLPDIDGQFLILNKDDDSSSTSADYALVHFFMPIDTAITTGNVYIFGQLSDWQCKKEFQCHYVDSLKGYKTDLYLKQGFYDYQYAFLNDHSKVADVTVLEGNHSETENTYSIYVYYRPVGIYYDQLIGIKSFHAPSN